MNCCIHYEELQETFKTVSKYASENCVEGDYMGVVLKGRELTIEYIEENPPSNSSDYATFYMKYCPFCGTNL